MMKTFIFFLAVLINAPVFAQGFEFTKADSLRGSLNPFRSAYNVYYYELNIEVVPNEKLIKGSNKIYFSIINPTNKIQVDLFENMLIDSIVYNAQNVSYERYGNAFLIQFPEQLTDKHMIEVFYHGQPIVAERPPWDGGFVWSKDKDENDWIGVAVQGIGASLWWPNKDHLTEEPDSMRIICTVPENFLCVSNGQYRGKSKDYQGKATYEWFVGYPINNYNVTLNIAQYDHFSDEYLTGDGDTLKLDYYVLPYNISQAKVHFRQVPPMLKFFEDLLGPYPFINDGYKLVETPYWGMEHQSAIAYGNHYRNNEFGFDFIILHESAHEYWGNSITTHDLGEMWIHESFGTYMEALYVEHKSGYDSMLLYLQKQKAMIKNNMAIQQPTGVNFDSWQDADMYYKGTWMLHTIRNVINNDNKWYKILYDLYQNYKLSIVTADEIIAFIDDRAKQDLKPIFDQYLNYSAPPKLLYEIKSKNIGSVLRFRWQAEAERFRMPLKLDIQGKAVWIQPKEKWQSVQLDVSPDKFVLPTQHFYFLPIRQ